MRTENPGRFVAFLRGMNLGRRRVKNEQLCARLAGLGFDNVSAFLASGNLIFDASGRAAGIASDIEHSLREGLGYKVPVFLRRAAEVRAIAECRPFAGEPASSGGKLQVALLASEPSATARSRVLAQQSEADRLMLCGRELFWLPRGKLTESDLDLPLIEATLGPLTIRTFRTVDRIVKKYLV